MRHPYSRAALASLTVLALLPVIGGSALAQYDRRSAAAGGEAPEQYEERSEGSGGGLFGGFFGGSDRGRPQRSTAEPHTAQMSAPDLTVRLERLENQLRQLTGSIEQLQFRNQQLEQQVRRNQEDFEYRLQEMSGGRAPAPRAGQQGSHQGAGPQAPGQHAAAPAPAPIASAPPVVAAPPPGRRAGRSDAFDPNETPNAPGAPRALGSMPTRTASAPVVTDEAPIGARGGREAGAPLDLGNLSDVPGGPPPVVTGTGAPPRGEPRTIPGALPAPPPRNSSATGGQVLASAPSATPRDEFALAQGYVQRRDYAMAEESLREFLKKHPADRLVADAHFWLGESLYQRQRYRDAAESFLTVSTKYDKSGKAPEALLRLAQSLSALGEREAACATFGEVGRKFPKATSVKQNAEREQKRARC